MKVKVISSSEGLVLDTEIKEAVLPTLNGQIGILPGHSDFYTVLKEGNIMLKGEENQEFEVKSGFAVVKKNDLKIFISQV